ncbi:MAG: signal recognition particle-docking protein FtsY [Rhizobiales bacterium]|nr:signal recognition particle-docking protein FtsY [Hyphomicrobiales bacterium]
MSDQKPGFFKRLFGAATPDQPSPPPVPTPPEAPAGAFGAPAIAPDRAPEAEAAPALVASQAPAPASAAPPATEPRSWWRKLKEGLSRSSSQIGQGIVDLFTKRKLDEAALEDLEDILVRADLGVAAATRITEAVGKGRYDKEIDPGEVKAILAAEVERTLAPVARPLVVDATKKPFVILVIGVNGSGKTTTIGKLAAKLTAQGRSVLLAAGDTFRAAAIEQLKIWAARTGAAIVARDQGADAAGLAFDALKNAQESGADIVLMDTAGRLQNRKELMDELEKVVRVMKKIDAEAPHAVLLVLDATVGQNALQQVEIFSRVAGVTGLVMTKLDGTAKGGILVAIADRFGLPVHFIGVGEGVDDLEPFQARDFARAIAGLE